MEISRTIKDRLIALWEEKAYLDRRQSEVQGAINAILGALGAQSVEMDVVVKPPAKDPKTPPK